MTLLAPLDTPLNSLDDIENRAFFMFSFVKSSESTKNGCTPHNLLKLHDRLHITTNKAYSVYKSIPTDHISVVTQTGSFKRISGATFISTVNAKVIKNNLHLPKNHWGQ